MGAGVVISDVHLIASGSGLHISVPSHVTIVTADTYPASHWMVTMDPGKLETGPNAPFMGLVNTGQPSERKNWKCDCECVLIFSIIMNATSFNIY